MKNTRTILMLPFFLLASSCSENSNYIVRLNVADHFGGETLHTYLHIKDAEEFNSFFPDSALKNDYNCNYFLFKDLIIIYSYLPCIDDEVMVYDINNKSGTLYVGLLYTHHGMLTAIGRLDILIQLGKKDSSKIESIKLKEAFSDKYSIDIMKAN